LATARIIKITFGVSHQIRRKRLPNPANSSILSPLKKIQRAFVLATAHKFKNRRIKITVIFLSDGKLKAKLPTCLNKHKIAGGKIL